MRYLVAVVAFAAVIFLAAACGNRDDGLTATKADMTPTQEPEFTREAPDSITFHKYTGRCLGERDCVLNALSGIEQACNNDKYCVSASILESEVQLCGDADLCLAAITAYDLVGLCESDRDCYDVELESMCEDNETCYDLFVEASLWLSGE